eukprot:TRINITY_DN10840_c0_g1_i1.p1 TRINITY_DN10840_c0_g1~~TRINITY_DN10840_c0_g1_i1.p1  ORF type:complete len:447 (-),score=57.76 TRINITY_DN10840_c0_g1_i1:589-1929(-)
MNLLLGLMVMLFGWMVVVSGFDVMNVDNEGRHHTRIYEGDYLVLRRGFVFKFGHDEELGAGDSLILVPVDPISLRRSQNAFSRITVPYRASSSDGWRFYKEGDLYHVDIPVDAEIGMWTIDLSSKGSVISTAKYVSVIFNPYHSSDQVYIQNNINEYLLNRQARIWMGSVNSNAGFLWIYDQFTEDAFIASMYLLSKFSGSHDQLSDPVYITRYLAKVVNANSGFGVLIGKWTTPYTGGTHPTDWHNSNDILRQFRKTLSPVRYAQCWVFGAILTTVSRSIGIPARTITTFGSAHEYKQNGGYDHIIDEFYDSNNNLAFATGSIWNFHVWTEVWLKRQDLSYSSSGWQAIDATPQELSFDNYYHVGPASVTSVKNKEISTLYDNDFVIGEVDSLYRMWVAWNTGKEKHPNYNYWMYTSSQHRVGTGIVTAVPIKLVLEGLLGLSAI